MLGGSLKPFRFILRGVPQGRYTDGHVSRREQRLVPLSFGIGCMVLVFVLLLVLAASHQLLAAVAASLISLALATLITHFARYKLSLHMIGISGAVATLCLLYGLWPLVLLPLGWLRWRVKAHTLIQAVCGSLFALLVPLVAFGLFGLL